MKVYEKIYEDMVVYKKEFYAPISQIQIKMQEFFKDFYSKGLSPTGLFIAVYFEEPKTMDQAIKMEFLLPCKSDEKYTSIFSPKKGICILHKGSYKNIKESYSILYNYITENKLTINNPPFEVYIKGEMDTKNEKEYETEICFPIN